MRPRDIHTLEDLRKIPIVAKQTLRTRPLKELMHDLFSPAYYGWNRTSGSTGEPFRFPVSSLTQILEDVRYSDFSRYRFFTWAGMPIEDVRKKMRIAQIRITPYPTHTYLFLPIAEALRNPGEALQRLEAFRPDVIEAMAALLVELARAAADRFNPLRCRYIVSYGEMLLPHQRKFIARAFGGEVYNHYGLEEVGVFGVECRLHQGFHVSEESHIVEVVDERGEPLPPGEIGRVIVTQFYNDVMPFIRYDTGDSGFVFRESCPCGLPAKRILIEGRRGAFLTVSSKKFHHIEFDGVMRHFSHAVLQYQAAKVAEHKIELRIVPAEGFHPAEIGRLQTRFREQLGIAPDIVIVKHLSISSRGKTSVLIDETIH